MSIDLQPRSSFGALPSFILHYRKDPLIPQPQPPFFLQLLLTHLLIAFVLEYALFLLLQASFFPELQTLVFFTLALIHLKDVCVQIPLLLCGCALLQPLPLAFLFPFQPLQLSSYPPLRFFIFQIRLLFPCGSSPLPLIAFFLQPLPLISISVSLPLLFQDEYSQLLLPSVVFLSQTLLLFASLPQDFSTSKLLLQLLTLCEFFLLPLNGPFQQLLLLILTFLFLQLLPQV